jgi:lipoprotein-releasing system permease protein
MTYETTIALRYLKSRRHGLFAFVTTLIAVGGVALGVAALIVTLAVMNGFRADIQGKTLGIQPHIVLLGLEKNSDLEIESLSDRLRSLPEIRSASPYILGQILLKSGRSSQGVVLKGIVPEKEFTVTELKGTLLSGEWSALTEQKKSIFLGKELARNLGLGEGDEVLALSPTESASLGAMGSVPKVEKFTVRGVFQSGFYEYDANLALVSLPQARELYGIAGVSGLGLKTNHLDRADQIAAKVGQAAGSQYWARSWQAMNRNLFEALKLEKAVMMLILTMIILVAAEVTGKERIDALKDIKAGTITTEELKDAYPAKIGARLDDLDAKFSAAAAADKNLIITHNLTAQNLLHAVKMGGLPVPSLAITKKDTPLTGFGEITLLGDSNLADPKGYASTKVYGADIYSPRYPSVTFEFTPNMRKRGEAILRQAMEATGQAYIEWSEVEKDGPREFERNTAFLWKFLTDKGLTPDVKRTEVKPLSPEMMPFAEGKIKYSFFACINDSASELYHRHFFKRKIKLIVFTF